MCRAKIGEIKLSDKNIRIIPKENHPEQRGTTNADHVVKRPTPQDPNK